MKKWVFVTLVIFVFVGSLGGTIYLVASIQQPQAAYQPVAVEVPLAPQPVAPATDAMSIETSLPNS